MFTMCVPEVQCNALKYVINNNLSEIYAHIITVLRTLVIISVAMAAVEPPFSKLKRIKKNLPSFED
jgi:hypothetical protein